MDLFDGLVWDMANPIYFSASLQVPASEVPDDYTAAKRLFTIERHGGMVLFRLGPVEGQDGESYSALLSGAHVTAIISALEVVRANLGR
jgi:hypothetical protein